MEQVCLVLPLLEGHQAEARQFQAELTEREAEYRASQERLGTTKEVWFLAAEGDSDGTLIAYLETDSFVDVVGAFAGSDDPFDQWFKERLAACTGVDLNDPPELVLPDLLSTYAR